MFNIGSFFEKFKKHELNEVRKRSAVVEIIKKVTNIDVDLTAIKFEKGRIVISASPLVKNEIFIKKQKILPLLKAEFPSIPLDDII